MAALLKADFIGPYLYGVSAAVIALCWGNRFYPSKVFVVPAEKTSDMILPYLVGVLIAPPTIYILRKLNKVLNWGGTNNAKLTVAACAGAMTFDAIVARNGEWQGHTGTALEGCDSATFAGLAAACMCEILM